VANSAKFGQKDMSLPEYAIDLLATSEAVCSSAVHTSYMKLMVVMIHGLLMISQLGLWLG
jgi:hypothetical protein